MSLDVLGDDQGYLKAGILGFQGSGKSYTGMLLGIATARLLGQDGPPVMFDTEAGSSYLSPMVKALTGQSLIGKRSQRFDDLLDLMYEAEKGKASFVLVDSVTHIWRNLIDSYMDHMNEIRRRKRLEEKTGAEFQDWGPIKRRWNDWVSLYINSPLNVIFCGRAGFEWDLRDVEKPDGKIKKEITKIDTKLKAETEFGYEASLLIELELMKGEDRFRRATINKDRFGVIDGREAEFRGHQVGGTPDYEADLEAVLFFARPHLELLAGAKGKLAAVDMRSSDRAFAKIGTGDDPGLRKKKRTALVEKVQAGLHKLAPSNSKDDKTRRIEILEGCFGTVSMTEVEMLPEATLVDGLRQMGDLVHVAEGKTAPGEIARDVQADLDALEVSDWDDVKIAREGE